MGQPRSRDLAFGEMPVRCCREWCGERDLSSIVPSLRDADLKFQIQAAGNRNGNTADQAKPARLSRCHRKMIATSPSGLEPGLTRSLYPASSILLPPGDDSEHHVQPPLGPIVAAVHSLACQELYDNRCKGELYTHSPNGHDRACAPAGPSVLGTSPNIDAPSLMGQAVPRPDLRDRQARAQTLRTSSTRANSSPTWSR